MTFTRAKAAGWGFQEPLSSGQMNQLDIDHTFALDGRDGGTYNATAGIEWRNTWIFNGDSLPIAGTDTMLTVFGSTSYNSATPAVTSLDVTGHSNLGGDAGSAISAVGGPSTADVPGIAITAVGGASLGATAGGIGISSVGGTSASGIGGIGAQYIGAAGDTGGVGIVAVGGVSTGLTSLADGGLITGGAGVLGGVGLRLVGGAGSAVSQDGDNGVALIAVAGARTDNGGSEGATAAIFTGGDGDPTVVITGGHGIQAFGGSPGTGNDTLAGHAIRGTGGDGGANGAGGSGGDFIGGLSVSGAGGARPGPAINLRIEAGAGGEGAHIHFDSPTTLPDASNIQTDSIRSYKGQQLYYSSGIGSTPTYGGLVPLAQVLVRISGGAGGGVSSIGVVPVGPAALGIGSIDNPTSNFTVRIAFANTMDSLDDDTYLPEFQYIRPQAIGGVANADNIAIVVTEMTDTHVDIQFIDLSTGSAIDIATAIATEQWGFSMTINPSPQPGV